MQGINPVASFSSSSKPHFDIYALWFACSVTSDIHWCPSGSHSSWWMVNLTVTSKTHSANKIGIVRTTEIVWKVLRFLGRNSFRPIFSYFLYHPSDDPGAWRNGQNTLRGSMNGLQLFGRVGGHEVRGTVSFIMENSWDSSTLTNTLLFKGNYNGRFVNHVGRGMIGHVLW